MPQGSVHGVAKSQTWLSDWTTIARICYVGLFLSVEMTTPSFARTCNYNHVNNACQPSVANLVFPSSANFLYNKCQAALDNQQIADNAHCCITLTLPRPLFAASDLWPHREPRCNKATTVIRVRIHVIFLALVETVKIPFIFNYYLFGPFLQRARGCLISQAEPSGVCFSRKECQLCIPGAGRLGHGAERPRPQWGWRWGSFRTLLVWWAFSKGAAWKMTHEKFLAM